MLKKFYISDLHIGDKNSLWYDNRPFKDLDEMLRALVKNWNRRVDTDDTVYILGNIFAPSMPAIEQDRILSMLNGRKILIKGDYERDAARLFFVYNMVYDTLTVEDGNDVVYLSHYPCLAFPGFRNGGIHLYGHVRSGYEYHIVERMAHEMTDLYKQPYQAYNVGCMMPWMNYMPRTLEEIERLYKKNQSWYSNTPTQKMMTLSTAHITEETADALDHEAERNVLGLAVYPKCGDRTNNSEDFGWFIYLPKTPDQMPTDLPDDLIRVICYARSYGADILCLDTDGERAVTSLKTYDW